MSFVHIQKHARFLHLLFLALAFVLLIYSSGAQIVFQVAAEQTLRKVLDNIFN